MTILTGKRVWRRALFDRPARPDRLTEIEQANVRRAVAFLAQRAESPAALAKAMRLSVEASWKARSKTRRPTLRLAFIVARAAGVNIDAVLAGEWPRVCPTCGQPCS
jgi:hypothetical protein